MDDNDDDDDEEEEEEEDVYNKGKVVVHIMKTYRQNGGTMLVNSALAAW